MAIPKAWLIKQKKKNFVFKIYITFYARQLNYYHTTRGSCANIRCFRLKRGILCVPHIGSNDCFSFKNCSFWFWLKCSSIFKYPGYNSRMRKLHKIVAACYTKSLSIFILAPKSARLNTMTNDQHGTSTRYVYLTFRRHAISVFFLFCLLPIQLKFTVSVQQLWQNLFRLSFVFDQNGSQLPATRRFISNELYNCTVLIDHARDFIGFDFR